MPKKFNTCLPRTLIPFFNAELKQYKKRMTEGKPAQAWEHLERAHIIGQAYPVAHTRVHWLMLRFGFKIKDAHEIVGQLPRLLVGGIKSFVGKIPVGNTGGANVPPLKSMPISEDLQKILNLSKN